jgi:hypothetical protein
MKQKNFLFVDLVSALFLAFLLVSNFFGLLYITDGSIAFSAIGGIIIVIFYYFLVDLLKRNKEALLKKKLMHFSLLFILFFIAISGVSFVLRSHFLNIEYSCKSAIKDDAYQKLDKMDAMLATYKSRSAAEIQDLDSKLKIKLSNYKSSPNRALKNELVESPYYVSESALNNLNSIENVDSLGNSIVKSTKTKINKSIDELKSNISNKTTSLRKVFNHWQRMTLVSAYDKLNSEVERTQKDVDMKLSELPFDKRPTDIVLDKSKLPLNNPVQLNKKFAPDYTIPFVLIFLTHFLILIPFFLHKTRSYSSSSNSSIPSGSSIEI